MAKFNQSKNQNTLIYGSSSYIGGFLIDYFKDKNLEFAVCGRNRPNKKNIDFVESDVFDLENLKKIVKPYKNIIHLVGLKYADKAQENPDLSFKLNVLSVNNMLEACRQDSDKKIIFPSSSHVYGLNKKKKIKETSELEPANIYGWHKYIAEKLILSYNANFNMKYVILRLFKVYGPNENAMISSFLMQARKNKILPIYNGNQKTDAVHGRDAAKAFYEVINRNIQNKVINIASGKGRKIIEYADAVASLYPGTKVVSKEGKEKQHDMTADIGLARKLLNFKPNNSKKFFLDSIKEINENLK